MHTTTVRFPDDTWAQLKAISDRERIPVAQFIREATIARIAGGLYRADLDDHEARIRNLEETERARRRADYSADTDLSRRRAWDGP